MCKWPFLLLLAFFTPFIKPTSSQKGNLTCPSRILKVVPCIQEELREWWFGTASRNSIEHQTLGVSNLICFQSLLLWMRKLKGRYLPKTVRGRVGTKHQAPDFQSNTLTLIHFHRSFLGFYTQLLSPYYRPGAVGEGVWRDAKT